MSLRIYVEGGGSSKELQIRCRDGFRRLFEKCGFSDRPRPRFIPCGSRSTTFRDFSIAHARAGAGDYVGMLVDSEDPVVNVEQPWEHLGSCDN